MRKLTAILLTFALLLGLVPAAFANTGEQIIHRQVGAGYFDIWLHSDGVTWQDTNNDGVPDVKGQKGKKHTQVYTLPDDKKHYEITRVEATHIFDQSHYDAGNTSSPKSWGVAWEIFLRDYLRYLPQ
ncbi:hypothetical protein [Desulfofalx alkaliphila]|uniref:hypothetical protein n=1 Tax=Desulfofalx alkaliphila TaxID=105483 RepID=UPI0004E242E9|nr:hypothetical protein [Desulfofalx alkaliphila]